MLSVSVLTSWRLNLALQIVHQDGLVLCITICLHTFEMLLLVPGPKAVSCQLPETLVYTVLVLRPSLLASTPL